MAAADVRDIILEDLLGFLENFKLLSEPNLLDLIVSLAATDAEESFPLLILKSLKFVFELLEANYLPPVSWLFLVSL